MNSSLNFQDPVCNRDSSICSDSKFGDEPPIILIGINYHVRNPAVVFGGAIMVIVVHLALAGGVAHIVSALKKRFHGEPDEVV
ncbi:MAG: hypothetical protein GY805_22940 [Chloroflexi bacterium]|nr:hypothetical protein [Chloroflexota bacterium]